MTLNAIWFTIFSLGVPFALIAGVVAVVQGVRKGYGEPELDGRLLCHDDWVHAQSIHMIGAPPFRIWITDREIVLRFRPGHRLRGRLDVDFRIPAAHVASVLELPDGKLRLGLTGGEGRHWDFPDPPAGLKMGLRKLAPAPPHRPK